MVKNVVIGGIYRAPNTDINTLNDQIATRMDQIKQEEKICYLMGDYNINLQTVESHGPTSDLVEMLGNMAAGQAGLWAAPENPVPSALYCEQKTAGNVLKHGDTIHLTWDYNILEDIEIFLEISTFYSEWVIMKASGQVIKPGIWVTPTPGRTLSVND